MRSVPNDKEISLTRSRMFLEKFNCEKSCALTYSRLINDLKI